MTSSQQKILDLSRYHVRARRGRIKHINESLAVFEHRALIDRAFVGDFATVDRKRCIEKQRPRHARRGTGRSRRERGKTPPEFLANFRIANAEARSEERRV